MDLVGDIASVLLFAQEGGAAAEEESGNFLVSPNVGLMIWTLLAFGATLFLLNKLAFPRIAEALDKRRKAIEESIEDAARAKREADDLLEEYRARLREAREQAEDITVRARKAADVAGRRGQGAGDQAARGAAGGHPPRHRGRDPPGARRDPQGGRQPDGARHREGHSQVADAGRPPAPDRGGARRGRLLRAVGEESRN